MKLVFDLDGTLCCGRPYKEAKPFPGAAKLLSDLRKLGHHITIYTARGMDTYNGDEGKINKYIVPLTLKQMDEWGFKYDAVRFMKPAGQLYIDDLATNVVQYSQLMRHIGRMSLTLEQLDSLSLDLPNALTK